MKRWIRLTILFTRLLRIENNPYIRACNTFGCPAPPSPNQSDNIGPDPQLACPSPPASRAAKARPPHPPAGRKTQPNEAETLPAQPREPAAGPAAHPPSHPRYHKTPPQQGWPGYSTET
eukprot:169937-Chlamydomonas_euryale.AAC.1